MTGRRYGGAPHPHRRLARGWLIILSAFTLLCLSIGSIPSTAQVGKNKSLDYPGLFKELSKFLKHYYLDLDRINARISRSATTTSYSSTVWPTESREDRHESSINP